MPERSKKIKIDKSEDALNFQKNQESWPIERVSAEDPQKMEVVCAQNEAKELWRIAISFHNAQRFFNKDR